MRTRRSNRGFEPCGRLPVDGLGLPRARARELLLQATWQRAAGVPIASHTSVTLRRGVLEVAVSDSAWRAAVEPLLADLARRMRRDAPSLGIRAVRLGPPAAERAAKPLPLDLAEDAPGQEGVRASGRPSGSQAGLGRRTVHRAARRG